MVLISKFIVKRPEQKIKFINYIALFILCCMVTIFIHSELSLSDVHEDNSDHGDFCHLVANSLQQDEYDFQKFEIEFSIFTIQKHFIVSINISNFLNLPINKFSRATPLLLLLATFII